MMKSINPATEQIAFEDERASDTTIDDALDTAVDTYSDWRDREIPERETLIAAAGDVLRENTRAYAETITTEMGKPISQALAEVEKCAWVCDYYAEHAGEHLQDTHIGSVPGAKTYVSYEPLGPVLAVMPWNYPFWQVFRFAAPALTAGNVGVLKHASNVPKCGDLIQAVFEEAGYPDGVFTHVKADRTQVDTMLADDRIKAATLTGSERAGRAVASTAGKNLKKMVLELGGSDPFIVLDDAPLDRACEVGENARCQNSGQSCIAAKRFVVHTDVYEEFLEGLTAEMEALTVGDPTEEATDVGPQAREDLLSDLHDQVERSIEAGATCHLGGDPLKMDGYFYPPTILTDVPRDAPAAVEETFGPLAAVLEVNSEDEAIEVANDTRFGLSATIWTEDRNRGKEVAEQIETGAVFVNQIAKSDPRLPFGGVKDSGYGRELSKDGIHEFVNRKTVWIE